MLFATCSLLGTTWERSRDGGDLDDNFMEGDEDEGRADLATRLKVAGVPQASDDEEHGS